MRRSPAPALKDSTWSAVRRRRPALRSPRLLAAVVDPHVIVLGGSVATAFDCFGASLVERISEYIAPSAAEQLNILPSAGAPASAALGAAALVFSCGMAEL